MSEITYIRFNDLEFILYDSINWTARHTVYKIEACVDIQLVKNLNRIIYGSPDAEANGIKYFRMGRIANLKGKVILFSRYDYIGYDYTYDDIWYSFNTETRELREVDDCNILNLLSMIK